MKLRQLLLGRKAMTNLDSILKTRDIALLTKLHLVKAMVFPVVMYGCESWTIKKAECWRIDAFKLWCWRRLLRVPWTARRSHPKGDQSWVFIGGTDVEAETPIFWPPDVKSWLIWKDPDAGKDWRWEEKGTTEDEMAGWHHWVDGHESEWALGVGHGQGSLMCCSPRDHKELDKTERLNWTDAGTGPPGSFCLWVSTLVSHHLLYFPVCLSNLGGSGVLCVLFFHRSKEDCGFFSQFRFFIYF